MEDHSQKKEAQSDANALAMVPRLTVYRNVYVVNEGRPEVTPLTPLLMEGCISSGEGCFPTVSSATVHDQSSPLELGSADHR